MATLRKANAYSKRTVVPFTRVSKKRTKAYVKTVPAQKIVKFTMGKIPISQEAKVPHVLTVVSTEKVQLRHNALEATRQFIINEVYKVIENQGLNVDIRHIMLIADTMCNTGLIKGITRYGVVSEKSSVLARASFETPIKHIINAALTRETDKLNSVVENVMLNQPVPIGTGLPGLLTKIK